MQASEQERMIERIRARRANQRGDQASNKTRCCKEKPPDPAAALSTAASWAAGK